MQRLRLLIGLGALAFGAGCFGTAPTARPALAALPLDTLFYISARARENGRDAARLAQALEYGLVVTLRATAVDPTGERVGFAVVDTLLLSREQFVEQLHARVMHEQEANAFAVFYTHGYGTGLSEAWEHSTSSRTRARGTQPWVVFAWPSIGSGVAWPRAGELLGVAYLQDSASAAASRGAYAEALRTLHESIGGERILAVAHSMGGQLMGETLADDSTLRALLIEHPLRALAFVSPDVEATRFGDVIVPRIEQLTHRLLLYASSDDRVLAMSEIYNDSERAGRIADARCGPIVRDALETVDMTEGVYADSRLIHALGTRHALRRKSAVLFDLMHVVGTQREASCRSVLGTGALEPTGVWKLTSAPLPSTDAVGRCAPLPSTD
jgi:pimeloyl-ACP methyl ester carboxylesterase